MLVDQCSMGQRFFAAVLAPRFVFRQFELEAETGMKNVEGRDDAIQNVNPDAVIPHVVQALLQRRVPHDFASGIRLVQITDDGRGFGDGAAVRELEGRRLAPRIHFQMTPAALFANRRHVVNRFLELIGDALFVHEQAQALWVGESRWRGKNVQFAGHFDVPFT
jgi:hypothetical protein